MEQKLLQLLQSCKSIRELKQTHTQIFTHGVQHNKFLVPKLITLSFSFDSLNQAVEIFRHSHSPNVFSYNTMIECLITTNHRNHAFHTYNLMNSSSVSPNSFTFTFLIKSCKSSKELRDGIQVHTHVVKLGFTSSVFIQNTLLDFYSKCCGDSVFARKVFDEMPERDVVSWNSMISAYMASGEASLAVQLFGSMPERNIVSWNSTVAGLCRSGEMELAKAFFDRMPVRNEVSWNSMVAGYIKMGDMGNARQLFNFMSEKTAVSCTMMISGYAKVGDLTSASKIFWSMPVKNVISWNALISGYVQNNMFDCALNVFHRMLTDGECRPDEATLVSALSACAHLGSLEQGMWMESYFRKNNYELSVPLGNALIDMSAKCGDIENALKVFHEMTERCIITWTTIISGLAMNGNSREALSLFNSMCEIKIEPDDVIFISVLSACTHGGLIEEGMMVFNQMVQKFGIKPRIEHYGCMVDLLSRAGKVEEAFRFTMSMPIEPNAIIWATLLTSCKIFGKRDLAETIIPKILDLDPSNPGYIMLVLNLNASFGRWGDVLSFRAVMRKDGIEKMPGCSSIQIGSTVHEFMVKDTTHEKTKYIYETLDVFNDHLKAFNDNIK